MTETIDHAQSDSTRKSERLYSGSWRHLVTSDIQQMKADLEVARIAIGRHPNGRDHAEQAVHLKNAQDFLEQAQDAVDEPSNPLRWYDGSLVDGAFVSMHHANSESMYVLPDALLHARLPQIVECGAAELGAQDRRVEAVRAIERRSWRSIHVRNGVGLHRTYDYHDRADIAELVHDGYASRDEKYSTSRSFRNRIIRLIIIAMVVLAAVLWGAAVWSWSMEPLGVAAPNGEPVEWNDDLPATGGVIFAAVALMGAVGGFLSGIGPVAKTRGHRNPFSLPYYQMLLKLPVGAQSAIVGVLVLQVGFVPGMLPATTILGLLVWGIVFGAAQQGITRLVDRRVQDLVGNGSGTDDETEEAATPAAAPIEVSDTTARSTQPPAVKEQRKLASAHRPVR